MKEATGKLGVMIVGLGAVSTTFNFFAEFAGYKEIKELNVSIQRVADALKDNGFEGEITLNTNGAKA